MKRKKTRIRKPRQTKEKKGNCPRCGENLLLTEHHIIPQKLQTGNGEIYLCCRECHNVIEAEIRCLEFEVLRQHLHIYWRAVNNCKRR